jgi:RimJ/RimL family protein N-acetyltransferase
VATGQVVAQTVGAEGVASQRIVHTGSWLGRRFQRRGLGTETRAAVLELAFQGLGAEAATSGAIIGNAASKRVSEKLGYSVTGPSTVSPRGEPVKHYDLRIERADWRAPVAVELVGLEGCLALFGLT